MNCGLSLPVNYLAGSPKTDEDFLYQEHFKQPPVFLKTLKKSGATSIELRAIKATTEPKKASLAAKQILEAGLGTTIHGYLPQSINGYRFSENLSPIASIAKMLKKYQMSSTITLHCYRRRNENLTKLVDYNADYIQNLIQSIHDEKLPLKIALELNRNIGFTDPSVTYDTLVTVWNKINNPEMVGFCWDFGHSFWNTSKNCLDLLPPEDFLDRVIHTHIHDLSPDGETHWPLSEGVIPLKEFVSRLKERNYNGTYNLELRPERWHTVKDVNTGIFESMSILAAMI
jgi:sugar phosphate isomerase/epimerase